MLRPSGMSPKILLAAILLAASGGAALRLPPPDSAGSAHIYWIGPTGKDSSPGTSRNKPWKTFRYALSKLRPGDTLLLQDGVYESKNTGYPNVNCNAGAAGGTPAATITIKAEHERQAFLRGDGTAYPLAIQNCQYWNVEGLHVENGDFNNRRYNGTAKTEALFGDAIFLQHDSHLVLRRNILARDNRYCNCHLIDSYHVSDSLFAENEFYYFHRHAILDMYGDSNTYRRNYMNSRLYMDLPDGRGSEPRDRGDTGISLYPARNAILENNISENNGLMTDIQCAYSPYACDGNRFFGNISLHDDYGHVFKARGAGDGLMPHHLLAENEVVLDPERVGIYFRAVKDAHCIHCMVLGNRKDEASGVLADHGGLGERGDGGLSVYINNTLVAGFAQRGSYGIAIATGGGTRWRMDFVNAYNNGTDIDPHPPNANMSNVTSIDPKLGGCTLWIPMTSPMKGRGSNHSDIGANVLYRYKDGTLTREALWDRNTGEFPHGAIVAGLNDAKGQSAFDVNDRLQVNTGGCRFPQGY